MEGDTLEIQIRLAVRNDAEAIALVLYQAFLEYEPLYTAQGFAATTPTSAQIQGRMNEGPVWVALRNDAIVGTVSVVPKGDRLYIRGMAVLPNARALGIGERLLEVINTYACNGKFRGLFLSTTPFLARAIQLYEHSGFKRTAERPHDLFGTPLFTMEKQL